MSLPSSSSFLLPPSAEERNKGEKEEEKRMEEGEVSAGQGKIFLPLFSPRKRMRKREKNRGKEKEELPAWVPIIFFLSSFLFSLGCLFAWSAFFPSRP